MTSLVNVFLTDNQRAWLMDEYLNKLVDIGESQLIDDCTNILTHMQNHEFYAECQSFMPSCMRDMSAQGVR